MKRFMDVSYWINASKVSILAQLFTPVPPFSLPKFILKPTKYPSGTTFLLSLNHSYVYPYPFLSPNINSPTRPYQSSYPT